ncbi:MAG: head-tail connector protein [Alphaproteobacteria bacterium]|nr:head-tail connector protein [Alphaproteobacteria bacterium]
MTQILHHAGREASPHIDDIARDDVINLYDQARAMRDKFIPLWRDCYDYALPMRDGFSNLGVGARRGESLFDATAQDCTDELAALMLGFLTPPRTKWFELVCGSEINEDQAQKLRPLLDKTTQIMQSHLDHSNFLVEVHQCFLDLVVAGTASLAMEETLPGALSCVAFTAVPLHDVMLSEGEGGLLNHVYRRMHLNDAQLMQRYNGISVPPDLVKIIENSADGTAPIIECIIPKRTRRDAGHDFDLMVISEDTRRVIYHGNVTQSPYINFRWMKSPGEGYGRSPVMKALPDIRTANKVVELVLKNASIAVTGIWQAEDDGVINPATIELVPGAIIPKAMGSRGLQPLEMPARFDVSQLVLDDLRARIRHAMLVDRLPMGDMGRATATEVTERMKHIALLLGATFGRLQVELLNPLILRLHEILRRRGAVPDLPINGRIAAIEYLSPLSRS